MPSAAAQAVEWTGTEDPQVTAAFARLEQAREGVRQRVETAPPPTRLHNPTSLASLRGGR